MLTVLIGMGRGEVSILYAQDEQPTEQSVLPMMEPEGTLQEIADICDEEKVILEEEAIAEEIQKGSEVIEEIG